MPLDESLLKTSEEGNPANSSSKLVFNNVHSKILIFAILETVFRNAGI